MSVMTLTALDTAQTTKNYSTLLYLEVRTRAVMGQFSGQYSPARTAKIYSFFVAKLLRDLYRQIFKTYVANKSLTLSFTLICALKRANDLKTISN